MGSWRQLNGGAKLAARVAAYTTAILGVLAVLGMAYGSLRKLIDERFLALNSQVRSEGVLSMSVDSLAFRRIMRGEKRITALERQVDEQEERLDYLRIKLRVAENELVILKARMARARIR